MYRLESYFEDEFVSKRVEIIKDDSQVCRIKQRRKGDDLIGGYVILGMLKFVNGIFKCICIVGEVGLLLRDMQIQKLLVINYLELFWIYKILNIIE